MTTPAISFAAGWYDEEKNKQLAYRWMSSQAKLLITGLSPEKDYWLYFLAGHSFQSWKPTLTIKAQGKIVGQVEIEASFSSYAFCFPGGESVEVEFSLAQSQQVPGDPRELGIMVSDIQLLELSSLNKPCPLAGWYLPEQEGLSPAEPRGRWIKQRATLALPATPKEEVIIELILGHPFSIDNSPNMKLFVNNIEIRAENITGDRERYILVIPADSGQILQLELDRFFPFEVSGDSRSLGIFIHEINLYSPQKKGIVLGEGWYEEESSEFYPFNWMSKAATIFLSSHWLEKNRYFSFYAFSEYANLSQELKIYLADKEVDSFPLLHKWNFYSLDLQKYGLLPKTSRSGWRAIKFYLNKIFPTRFHPQDTRELGARFSWFSGHTDGELHQKTSEFHQNARLNYQEMMAGKTVLTSFPQNLGVDLYAQCNIKPPCVYCLWTEMKKLEGKYVHEVVDEKTLAEYGPFFTSARTLVNCSFGEPLLHPRLKEILEFCARFRKFIEISTNGQAFTSEIIDILVGKPIFLYISLDAACRETYAKIRNDNWDSIIPRLVELNEKRKKHHNLPKIYMVFMPMKVNRDDLEEYFKLCRRIEADALVLRPLLYLYEPKIEARRGGYHFVYKDELLPEEEIKEIIAECRKLSKKYKIPLANQFEFGQRQEPQAADYERSLVDFQRS
ncbi:radical SAM protein [Candidatus Aminicenantes bacterium AC-334-K16]|jgi:wyosine [tRNA(Phe)-imidazoG37] synthetase (radical SAM superfamily)|nr:radical SAM protein [Candidatus Aminicenantes bacterium AC-334-K16]